MAVFQITPAPTRGGTISVLTSTTPTVAWTYLGNNKFMIFYRQPTPSPGYIVAHIVTYNGLDAPTVGPTVEIRSGYPAGLGYGFRAFYCGDDKVVLFYFANSSSYGVEVQFMSFDASDNILPSAPLTKKLVTSPVYVANTALSFCIEQLDATHFACSYYIPSSISYVGSIISVDPWGQTASITGWQQIGSGNSIYEFGIDKIPNTTKAVVTCYYYTSGATGSTYIVDATGARVSKTSSDIANMNQYRSLSENRRVWANSYATTTNFIETTWSPALNSTSFRASAYSCGSQNPLIIPFDENHFMFLTRHDGSINAMVFRFLDSQMLVCSAPSDKPGGVTLALDGITGGMTHFSDLVYTRQPAYQKIDDRTILIWFVWGGKLCYKVVYQPALI